MQDDFFIVYICTVLYFQNGNVFVTVPDTSIVSELSAGWPLPFLRRRLEDGSFQAMQFCNLCVCGGGGVIGGNFELD